MELLVGVLRLLAAVLMFGILRGMCSAGSVVDVRSAVGFASAGGAGQVWWVVSGGAVSRKRCRPCAESWRSAGSRAQKKSGCDRSRNHTRST